MVIGDGLIAKKFKNHKNGNSMVVYASGVSNSNNIEIKHFSREKKLLKETIKLNQDKMIIYFSSCDVIYAEKIGKPYYFHKLEMEKIIQERASKYNIFRLPQLIGYSNNGNTLLNFFINSIKNKKKLTIYKNAYKNLIDIDDVYKLISMIINISAEKNKVINIINPNYYSIMYIVEVIEKILGINAILSIKDKGFKPNYFFDDILLESKISFDDDYIEKSIIKHYKTKLKESII